MNLQTRTFDPLLITNNDNSGVRRGVHGVVGSFRQEDSLTAVPAAWPRGGGGTGCRIIGSSALEVRDLKPQRLSSYRSLQTCCEGCGAVRECVCMDEEELEL